MSTVTTTTVKTEPTTDTLTLGGTGDSVAISGDSLNLNTLQDAGGNTIFVSDGSGTITSSAFVGAMKLISSQTVTDQASVSFTSGLDSTYDVYCFKFIDINPATDNTKFRFQGSSNTGSSYGVTKTTTSFACRNTEANSKELFYNGDGDLAQSTSAQEFCYALGSAADECLVGEFYIFNPSSTTYVKNFYATVNIYGNAPLSGNFFTGGYWNTTSVIDAMQFTMSSGNFDGTIALYGISKT